MLSSYGCRHLWRWYEENEKYSQKSLATAKIPSDDDYYFRFYAVDFFFASSSFAKKKQNDYSEQQNKLLVCWIFFFHTPKAIHSPKIRFVHISDETWTKKIFCCERDTLMNNKIQGRMSRSTSDIETTLIKCASTYFFIGAL